MDKGFYVFQGREIGLAIVYNCVKLSNIGYIIRYTI